MSAILEKLGFGKPKQASAANPATPKTVARSTGKAYDFITQKNSDGTRTIVAAQIVPLKKSWFYNKVVERSYQIDASKFALGGAQPVLIHDQDIFEPLGDGDTDDLVADLPAHHSQRADNIIRLEFIRQAMGTLKGMASGFDWKVGLVFLVVGYFAGNSLPLHQFGL